MKRYIKEIIYVTLISAVVSQILPGDAYRKYGKMISGFIILLIFLHPVLEWSSIYPQLEQTYEQYLTQGKQQAEQGAQTEQEQLQEEVWQKQQCLAVQEDIMAMLRQVGYAVDKVEVSMKGDRIQWVKVQMQQVVSQEQEMAVKEFLSQTYNMKERQVRVW